ncbi:LuxR C-terminal-related transcriptional regulator [Streptomyces sp. NPDC059063]|uniref:helix-turn-helix transcriptional regulator n=1 Tax=unclassified Streptomyces TaxID=2593676 RepID=UPI0036A52BC9
MSTLPPRDEERVPDLAVVALREPDPRRLWHPVVRDLLHACGGEFLFLERGEWAGAERALCFWAADGAAGHRLDEDVLDRIRRGCPLADYYASSGDRTPRTATDVLGDRAWHGSETAKLLRDTLGTDHVLGLPLPDTSGPFRYLLICRSGPGFTASQLAYARRVQPLLAGVDAQAELLGRWRAADSPGSGRRARGPVPEDTAPGSDLTPRERTVLSLLADELTAAAIGRRLGISVHTVQKHLQSVYRKLGTRDRAATARRARTHGLASVPTRTPVPGGPVRGGQS